MSRRTREPHDSPNEQESAKHPPRRSSRPPTGRSHTLLPPAPALLAGSLQGITRPSADAIVVTYDASEPSIDDARAWRQHADSDDEITLARPPAPSSSDEHEGHPKLDHGDGRDGYHQPFSLFASAVAPTTPAPPPSMTPSAKVGRSERAGDSWSAPAATLKTARLSSRPPIALGTGTLRPVTYPSDAPPIPLGPPPPRSGFFIERAQRFRSVDWALAALLVLSGAVGGHFVERAADWADAWARGGRAAGRSLDDADRSAARADNGAPMLNEAASAGTASGGSLAIQAAAPAPRGEYVNPVASASPSTPEAPARAASSRASSRARATKAAATSRDRPTVADPATTPSALEGAMAQAAEASPAPSHANGEIGAASSNQERTWDSLAEAPGLGAVQAAIAPRMPAARACLRGESEASHANVVFAPSGRAVSVLIEGPAAGTSEEGCIRAVLMKATVLPFRRARYTVGVSIRP